MRPLALGLALALMVTSCRGGESRLESDLGAVTHVIEVPATAIEVTGKDISGNPTPSEQGQPRLDIIEVDVDAGTVLMPFEGTQPLERPVRVVRDPLPHGSLAHVVEGADRLILLAIPLVVPTRAGIDHTARVIALDAGREVLAADWPEAEVEQLRTLLAGSANPAATLAEAARAVAARALGQEPTPEQRRLLEALER